MCDSPVHLFTSLHLSVASGKVSKSKQKATITPKTDVKMMLEAENELDKKAFQK